MARHNLVIKIGSEPYYFVVDESALDYFQQADPKECLPTLLSFLKSCKEDGSIEINLNELSSSKIQISIPERNIDLTVQKPTVRIDWNCLSSSSDHEEDENLDKTCNSNSKTL